jgi:hypothetical protein
MAFRGVKPLADALTEGWHYDSFFTKTSSPAPLAVDHWADLSMGAGTPKYNAYVGVQYESTPLFGAGNFGIYSGGNIAPKTKHVKEICLGSSTTNCAPAMFELCDYLMFYPLIDCDSTDLQELDNVATLPRYSDGEGVKLMIVCTTPQSAVATITINYTNSQGVAKTATRIFDAQNVGSIQARGQSGGSQGSPFVALAEGDTGIRSIESVQLSAGAGGFVALVLVRPLVPVTLREQNTFTEIDYLFMRPCLRQVYDGAYLNFIYKGSVAGAVTLRGHITFTGA